jgi:uncharacterized membrane protein YvbJ
MQGAGLGMVLANIRNKKPTQKCNRCGQQYSIENEHCPHCHNLSEAELIELKKRISEAKESNRNLGKIFFLVAIVILALMVIFAS